MGTATHGSWVDPPFLVSHRTCTASAPVRSGTPSAMSVALRMPLQLPTLCCWSRRRFRASRVPHVMRHTLNLESGMKRRARASFHPVLPRIRGDPQGTPSAPRASSRPRASSAPRSRGARAGSGTAARPAAGLGARRTRRRPLRAPPRARGVRHRHTGRRKRADRRLSRGPRLDAVLAVHLELIGARPNARLRHRSVHDPRLDRGPRADGHRRRRLIERRVR